jgi:hypothetical protein
MPGTSSQRASMLSSVTNLSDNDDTITVDTGSIYSEDMPPPSNQSQGQGYNKRHRQQVSNDIASVSRVAERVSTLEQRVIKAREEKEKVLLLQKEATLQKELKELESFLG